MGQCKLPIGGQSEDAILRSGGASLNTVTSGGCTANWGSIGTSFWNGITSEEDFKKYTIAIMFSIAPYRGSYNTVIIPDVELNKIYDAVTFQFRFYIYNNMLYLQFNPLTTQSNYEYKLFWHVMAKT